MLNFFFFLFTAENKLFSSTPSKPVTTSEIKHTRLEKGDDEEKTETRETQEHDKEHDKENVISRTSNENVEAIGADTQGMGRLQVVAPACA